MSDVAWPGDWWPLEADDAPFFTRELISEVAPDHALYGRKAIAIAKNGPFEDVLYQLDDGSFAEVHLSFPSSGAAIPPWPSTAFFATFEEWRQEALDYYSWAHSEEGDAA